VVQKIFLSMVLQKRQENSGCIFVVGRVYFQANYAGMLSEGQNRPISKMLVQGNEYSVIEYGALNDLMIVGAILAHLGCPRHVMAFPP
jgi:hypothetical protein